MDVLSSAVKDRKKTAKNDKENDTDSFLRFLELADNLVDFLNITCSHCGRNIKLTKELLSEFFVIKHDT